MEEIDLETKSLKESNENQNESKRAPLWAFAMHWPIISGREATWGVLGAVGLPLQISLQIDDSIASMTTALSASLGHFQNFFKDKRRSFLETNIFCNILVFIHKIRIIFYPYYHQN